MIKNFFFFTATVLQWEHVLSFDKYKDIIIESFKFLVKEERVRIFAFVIMPNHFHTVWKINNDLRKSDFQRDMLKFTGQTILKDLCKCHPDIHREMYVGAKDRHYQFWEESVVRTIVFTKSSRAENKLHSFKSIKCKMEVGCGATTL